MPREPLSLDEDFPDVDAVLDEIEESEEDAEYTKGTEVLEDDLDEYEDDGSPASALDGDDELDFL